MNRPTWQFCGWQGIVRPALDLIAISNPLVPAGAVPATILPARAARRAAH